MGRALVAVGAALALCFAAIGVLIYVERQEDRVAVDNVLAEELSRELTTARNAPEPVVLAEVTPFGWDRVFVFARRTPPERISDALGFEFTGDLPYDVESQELFVFVRRGELVRFADYRGRDRFVGLDRPVQPLFPDEAVFEVGGGEIRLAGGG
jgi:hypothetical protein